MAMAELSNAWETFFSELASLLMTCQQHYGSANERFTEYALSTCCQSVSTLHNRISTVHSIDALGHNIAQLLDDLQQILQLWRDYFDSLSLQDTGMCYQAPTEVTSAPCHGRPRFNISADQLRSLSFSWSSIADMLMVSRMTIYRRRVEFGMLEDCHRSISEDGLVSIVGHIIHKLGSHLYGDY